MPASLPITTTSLLLRRFSLGDVSRVWQMSQEPGMRTWIPDQVYADEAEAREVVSYLIAQYDHPRAATEAPFVLAVVLRETDDVIGHVGLSPVDDGVEIGYAIAEAVQGRGFATEAVRAMADWGLPSFALPAIDAIVARDNRASCAVLERAGFALVGDATRSLHGVIRPVRTYRRSAA